MKKVLMVSINGLDNAGVPHVMMDIVRNLRTDFHFDMLLFTSEVRYFDEEFLKYGRIFRLPHYEGSCILRRRLDRYIRFWRLYKGVRKILQENGPYEVIHCNNYFDSAPCLLAAKHCGVPIRICHSHGVAPRTHKLAECQQGLSKKIIRSAATCKVGCSQTAAKSLFGTGTDSISIGNAIDLTRFNIQNYPGKKIKHSFIHIGRLCALKNQTFVLEVFKIIQTRWPDASLKFISDRDPEYKQLLLKKIENLQIKNVQFLPHDSDTPALLAQSEYMIFPSLSEGLPLVLLEAQAMHVKCIVADIITREANIGLCHYLCLQQSPKEWAQTVFDIETQPIAELQMSEIDINHYIQQIRHIYEQKSFYEKLS